MELVMVNTRQRRIICREHERLWNGRRVDRNLEDPWLETLNALSVFELISICEGHPQQQRGNGNRYPHINLRLRADLVPGLVVHWPELYSQGNNFILDGFATNDTSINFELRRTITPAPSGLRAQDSLIVRISSREPRRDTVMDPAVSEWFSKAIENIKVLDQAFCKWLGER